MTSPTRLVHIVDEVPEPGRRRHPDDGRRARRLPRRRQRRRPGRPAPGPHRCRLAGRRRRRGGDLRRGPACTTTAPGGPR
ncbi:hypothetical protein [Nocardioides convexus]|uniref:hypothetical protein n=1 Tax=Nocardioides convexus TaxID=2712224 RepID=UPI00241825AE|nr:hypothetical protein [Nocardioides convexus]